MKKYYGIVDLENCRKLVGTNKNKEDLVINYAIGIIERMEYGGETYDDYKDSDFENYDAYMEYYYGTILNSNDTKERYKESLELINSKGYKLQEISKEDYNNFDSEEF